MASFSLQIEPTTENVYKSLEENTLGNNSWINKCLNVLLKMDNTIVAFDADWGNGKTFLAKQFQMIINEIWEMQYHGRTESKFNDIKELNFENIISDSYYAIYYNAWEYDNNNDPIASFLYYLLKILNKKIPNNKFNNVASNFKKNVIDKLFNGFIKIDDSGKEDPIEKVLSSVIETETVREEINNLLNEIREEKFNNLIIFIDELDRCRPTYALRIIEMIKHYLKMDNILIVCMTDIKQLSNCIKSIYGNEYDSNMYLDKIIDYKFKIPNSNFNVKSYINMKMNTSIQEIYYFDLICLEIIKYFSLSIRNIDKYLGYIGKMFDANKSNNREQGAFIRFVMYLFVPYYVAVALFKPEIYKKLMNGDLSDYLNFCKIQKIEQYIKRIYGSCSIKDYDEANLFNYFSHDCKLIIRQINGEKYITERFFVDKTRFYHVERYLNNIDLLDFFINNTINK